MNIFHKSPSTSARSVCGYIRPSISAVMLYMLCFSNSYAYASKFNVSSNTKTYGLCKDIEPQHINTSHWCQKGQISGKPFHKSLKYGRQTIFSSTDPKHKGWCGWHLSNWLYAKKHEIGVAVSTKYIKQSREVSPYSPVCGKCMCVRVVNTDNTTNPNAPKDAKKVFGSVFKGRVVDVCPECSDDHIDILAGESYAKKVPLKIAYGVGIWLVEWQFVNDCNINCEKYFKQKQRMI